MKGLVRRLAAGAAALAAASAFAQSDFPSKPIQMIVPYTPGGADTQIRALGPTLSAKLGQQVVIENVPGAGGIIATNRVKNATPDGYTLYFTGTATLTMLPNMRKDVTFSLRDFVPIGNITGTAGAIAVRAVPEYTNLQEFVAYAKANPHKINLGTSGTGTLTHILGAAMQTVADIHFTHIPYKGVADAVTAMVAGNVDIVFGLPAVMMPHVRAGKLRFIATMGPARSEFVPEVPTLKEAGYDFVDVARFGVLAPKGVPQPVVDKLAAALKEAVASPEYHALMKKSFTTVLYHSPTEFQAVLEEENRRWAALLSNPRFAEAMK